jgi:putative membrane protein
MMSNQPARKAASLIKAEFNPRLKTYLHVTTIFLLTITVVGILLIPFWLIFGRAYVNRYFNGLFCELTTRALHFKKGVWIRTEKTIPLDKIQDLTFKEGPLLRYFGVSYLKIETAGQSAQGISDMTLYGIIDARNFREAVLDQRDITTDKGTSDTGSSASTQSDAVLETLKTINETLGRIEKKMS